jgi:6-phosphogluconolactonase (cycloisomerase 2 family)
MVEIYDSGDNLLTTGSYTLSDVPDGSSGTIAFSATVPTDTAGRFSFKIFVTDTSGRDSNSLSGDFDVTMGVLDTITLSPAAASVPLGRTQQLTLEGTLSDNTSADPLYFSTCTFVSSATDKATVDANGLVTPNAVGQATINATCGPLSAMSVITVTAAVLDHVQIKPSHPSLALGLQQQFTAQCVRTDASTYAPSHPQWGSSNTAVATIDANGLVTTFSKGQTNITLQAENMSASTTLTVLAPTIVSIAVTPEVAGVEVNGTRQFTATATRSDSTTQDVTATATWTSFDMDVATIDNSGLALGLAEGSSTIQAQLDGIADTVILTVNPAQEAGGLVYVWPFNQSNWYAYGIQGDGRLAAMPASPMQNDGALGGDRVVTDHSGSYAFTEYGTGIYASRIDRSAGTLTPLTGSPFTIPGDEPNGLWAHPTQPWMYAVSWQDWTGNTIRAYDITGEGFTTSDPGTDVGSNYAVAQAFTPDGAYFYMIGQDSNTIPYTFALLSFQVEPTNGQLTEILPRKSDVKFGMVVSPDGNHLYAGNNWNAVTDPGAIHHFSLDSMTGQLTLQESTPFAGQTMVMAFDPVDPLLYVLARDASFQAVLFVFEIDSMTGELIQLGVTNLDPQFNINRMDMRVAPHGGMLYAAAELFSSGNKVALVFSVNGTTGGVTELQRLTVTNGGYQPTILVIPPLPVE